MCMYVLLQPANLRLLLQLVNAYVLLGDSKVQCAELSDVLQGHVIFAFFHSSF